MAAKDADITLAVLKASYDYVPQSEDEIAIKEDQILLLKERVDEDWWKVQIKGPGMDNNSPAGLVPSAYVEQADHTSVVKALYDYEATSNDELTISENDILLAYDTDDDWLLVQTAEGGGRAGYVPVTYVEPNDDEGEPSAPAAAPHIVVPDSPPPPARPISTYVDPADLVASTKKSSDDIQTWSVSQIDSKGKKMKGTLGIGNGAVFFASESSKAAVQKWQTSDITNISIEKSKHVHFEVAGPTPATLHFNVGTKDNAPEAIVAKLESSRELSRPEPAEEQDTEEQEADTDREEEDARPAQSFPPPPSRSTPAPLASLPNKKAVSVHFSPASPVVIPPRDDSADEDDVGTDDGESHGEKAEKAIALYEFQADGDDELTVAENEVLTVVQKGPDEGWWKCRNSRGKEGVVPSAYLQPSKASHVQEDTDDDEESRAAVAREAEDRAQAKAEEALRKKREEEEREKKEKDKERQKAEAQKRAQDASKQAEEERQKRKSQQAARSRSSSEAPERKSSSSRPSIENHGQPPRDLVRIWHDRTGQFRVDAALLGMSNGKLRLHKTNGVIVEVPVEKMSAEDLKYVEKMESKKKSSSRKAVDDDDVPLAVTRRMSQAVKKAPTIDWFDFFLSAGCDIDDCTRYAASFERDKIDEAILPDITDATMRSLGLREGDIIRVTKAIANRQPKTAKPGGGAAEQLRKDEEMAKKLQAEENARKTPPSLFTGVGGTLKANRRGRPTPSRSTPPATVDLNAIGSIPEGIVPRTDSPRLVSSSPAPVNPPPRSSSAAPAASSGFDDDAWAPRHKPATPAPETRAPSAPLPSTAAPVPAAPPQPAPSAAPAPPSTTSPTNNLAATTDADIFDQLSRLSALRNSTPQSTIQSTPPLQATPTGYPTGAGPSPAPPAPPPPPQQQQSYNGPRGPFAPVPANQGLLQPLVPTQTGFNSFIPTRPSNASPFGQQASPFANPQPSFLQSQPTGFPQMQQPQQTGFPQMQPQQTGFPQMQQQPQLMAQPTGLPFGGMNGMGGISPIHATNSFGSTNSYGSVSTNPTGFNPGFGASPFGSGSGMVSPPPPPMPNNNASANNTNPANIFAQMKSGTFGNDNAPQSSDKYDALRPNPVAQPTGWGGYQGYN